MLAKLVNDSSTPARNRVGDMKQCPEWGKGWHCFRRTRRSTVGRLASFSARPSSDRSGCGLPTFTDPEANGYLA
jgi:hypothetical protein